MKLSEILSKEFALAQHFVENALEMYEQGATVPFIARYRKEQTGEMNEIVLRNLFDRFEYLTELEERKIAVLESIRQQGKLTDILEKAVNACLVKTELEDLYLPFKPKRRTRATIAREKGLEGLAREIAKLNSLKNGENIDLSLLAEPFINPEKEVASVSDALIGASDILAEEVAEKAEHRALLRSFILNNAIISSSVKPDFPEGTTKFEMYRSYSCPLKTISPHNLLALRRGEADEVLSLSIDFDEDYVLTYLESKELISQSESLQGFYKKMLKDAYQRLMKYTLIGEVRLEKKIAADVASIENFGENLRNLLLASPAGMQPTLGIDPGFRTGCKLAAVSPTGKFLEYKAIFPHNSLPERQTATRILKDFIERHNIKLIAIGNGTACRETDEFVSEVLQALSGDKPTKVIVSESGASVYSASEVAIEEFPDLDITVRGAISIARRLQDPLAELVKIDPKSIGVGQYQHDVDQKLLKKKLEEIVESCVNFVGVEVNTASKELLGFVAGISDSVAKNIVAYRDTTGAFKSREELLKISKFGAKTFEQCAGFLKIREAVNPLDNSSVHPERYKLVEKIANDVGVTVQEMIGSSQALKKIDVKKYVSAEVGEPTLKDIVKELEKPGRDPRAEFRYATFGAGITSINDLKVGMELEGVITNVANFGAFVDIGVHQDGLVHISQMANRFVSNPLEIVKVGQIVKVWVVEVNVQLKRISLTMKGNAAQSQKTSKEVNDKPSEHSSKNGHKNSPKHGQASGSATHTMEDSLAMLKAKFEKS